MKSTRKRWMVAVAVLAVACGTGWTYTWYRTAQRNAQCVRNLEQIGAALHAYMNDSKGEYSPPLSLVPGRLMFDRDAVYPTYLTEPMWLVSPFHPDYVRFQAQDSDPESLIDDASYWYLGYIFANERSAFAWIDEYKKRASPAGNFLPMSAFFGRTYKTDWRHGTGKCAHDTTKRWRRFAPIGSRLARRAIHQKPVGMLRNATEPSRKNALVHVLRRSRTLSDHGNHGNPAVLGKRHHESPRHGRTARTARRRRPRPVHGWPRRVCPLPRPVSHDRDLHRWPAVAGSDGVALTVCVVRGIAPEDRNHCTST